MRNAVTAAASVVATAAAAVTAGASVHTGNSLSPSSSAFLVARRLVLDSIPRGGASKHDVPHTESDTTAEDSHRTKPGDSQKSKKKAKKTPKKGARRAAESTEEATATDPRATTSNKDEPSKTTTKENSSSSSSKSMSPHQERIVNEILKEDDYFKILGTSREATATEIQKAYRKRAVWTHPDKIPNGDRRAFDKVAEAYDVLSDETKRKQYNQFGKAGGGAPPSSAEDIFRSFFSSQHHPFFRSATTKAAPPRNRNVRYQLEVTLEDLYKGLTKSVLVSQPSPYANIHVHHQLKRKRVEVHIPAGSFGGQSIVLSGEMDWDQEQTPADIVFILVQRPHPTFTRKGYDLAMEISISLEEALSGVRRSFQHLDGRTIVVESAHNAHSDVPLVVQEGSVQVLKGEGMPKRNGKGHGDLFIQYKVEMPSPTATQQYLTPEERDELRQLLSKLQKTHHYQQQHHDTTSKTSAGDENNVRILQSSSAADFGRNAVELEDEDHDAANMAGDDNEGESAAFRSFPFGVGGGRQFFYSSSSSTDSHPFFREDWKDDGNGNVQCQQM